jgi:hypothetical protein
VLDELVGRTPVEVAKSILLGGLLITTVIALVQASAERSQGNQGQQARTAVLATAKEFGVALTTYDYAHPAVQESRLAGVAVPDVVGKVRSAEPDLVQYRASSLGEAPDLWMQDFDGHTARVLIKTRSTIESSFAPPGTKASGLVSCQIEAQSGGWRVTSYQWLTPATETGPGYSG